MKIRRVALVFSIFSLNLEYLLTNTIGTHAYLKLTLRVISIFFAFLSTFGDVKTGRGKLGILVFCISLSIACIGVKNAHIDMTYMVTFAFLLSTIEPTSVFRSLFIAYGMGTIVWVVMLLSGLIKNVPDLANYLGVHRYTLGFINVNAGALYFYGLLVLIALYKFKHTKIKIAFLTIAISLVYAFTRTRTFLLAMMAFVAFSVFYSMNAFSLQFKKRSTILFIILITLVAILPSTLSDSLPQLNSFFSNRLALNNEALRIVSPWELVFGSLHEHYVDNGYIMVILGTGALVLIAFMGLLVFQLWTRFGKMRPEYLAVVLSILVYNIMEDILLSPTVVVSITVYYCVLHEQSDSLVIGFD